MPKTLLIIYHSNSGKTEKMASQIARGVEKASATAILRKVEDCTLNDLAQADGIAVGTPTQYGNVSWQTKRFMDETLLSFYAKGHTLRNKVCGCFTSTGAYNDGKECIKMLEFAFGFSLKMKIIPGIILESRDIDEGKLSMCYEYGQKIAAELT